MTPAPIREALPVENNRAGWTQEWARFFAAILRALSWSASFTATKTHDFGSINGGAEGSTTVTVTGALVGDTVTVAPLANTAGIIYTGVVTATNTVTIYAKNFTSAPVDPASTTFRVTVLQV